MLVYFKKQGITQGKFLIHFWVNLDRSDLKKVLLTHDSEDMIRREVSRLTPLRGFKLQEVRE